MTSTNQQHSQTGGDKKPPPAKINLSSGTPGTEITVGGAAKITIEPLDGQGNGQSSLNPTSDRTTESKSAQTQQSVLELYKSGLKQKIESALGKESTDLSKLLSAKKHDSWPKLYRALAVGEHKNKFEKICTSANLAPKDVLGLPTLFDALNSDELTKQDGNHAKWRKLRDALNKTCPTPEDEGNVKKIIDEVLGQRGKTNATEKPAPSNSKMSTEPATSQNSGPTPASSPQTDPERESALKNLKDTLDEAVASNLYTKSKAQEIYKKAVESNGVNSFNTEEIKKTDSLVQRRIEINDSWKAGVSESILKLAEQNIRDQITQAVSEKEFGSLDERIKGLRIVSKQLESGLGSIEGKKKILGMNFLNDKVSEGGMQETIDREALRLSIWEKLSPEQRTDQGLWDKNKDKIYQHLQSQREIPNSLKEALESENDFNLLDQIGNAYNVPMADRRKKLEELGLMPSITRLEDLAISASEKAGQSNPPPGQPPSGGPQIGQTPPTKPQVVCGNTTTGEKEIEKAWLKDFLSKDQETDLAKDVKLISKGGNLFLQSKIGDLEIEVLVNSTKLDEFDSLDEAKSFLLTGYDPNPKNDIDNDFFRHLTLNSNFTVSKISSSKTYDAVGLNLKCLRETEVSLKLKDSVLKITGDNLELKDFELLGSSSLDCNCPEAKFHNYQLSKGLIVTGNLDRSVFVTGRNESDMTACSMKNIQVQEFSKNWKGTLFDFYKVTQDTFRQDLVKDCQNYAERKQELNILAANTLFSDGKKVERIISGYSGQKALSLDKIPLELEEALKLANTDSTNVISLNCSLPALTSQPGAEHVYLVIPKQPGAIKNGELIALGVVSEDSTNGLEIKKLNQIDLQANLPDKPETHGIQYALLKYLEWLSLEMEDKKKRLRELDLEVLKNSANNAPSTTNPATTNPATMTPVTAAPTPSPAAATPTATTTGGPTVSGTGIFEVA